MTTENTATGWRDLTDQLTDRQVCMLAGHEGDGLDAETLLFMARDLAGEYMVNLVHGPGCEYEDYPAWPE